MEDEFTPSKKFFLKKSPSELNVGESLAAVALYPVALLGGIVVLGAGIVGWSKLTERFKKDKTVESIDIESHEVE